MAKRKRPRKYRAGEYCPRTDVYIGVCAKTRKWAGWYRRVYAGDHFPPTEKGQAYIRILMPRDVPVL